MKAALKAFVGTESEESTQIDYSCEKTVIYDALFAPLPCREGELLTLLLMSQ